MIDVKIYLKSKKKPILLTLETVRQKQDLLNNISTDAFVNIGCFTINSEDIAYILFESSK